MAQQSADIALNAARSAGKTIKGLRWYICGLLFLVTLINYIDRQTMGVLNPIIKAELKWDDAGFGWINFGFTLAYALMFGVAGRILDKIGVKVGLIWAVVVWSVAAISHSLASGVWGFAIARFALGIGEAANFPGCIKSTAEWFPRRERAFAAGIFNSGSNFGVMLSPAIVLLATKLGWRAAFILTGTLGFLWVGLWALFYRSPESHPNLGDAERELIVSDKDDAGSTVEVPWTALLRYRQAWAFALGKMMTDPVWWFYLFWLPTYLTKERGVTALSASVMLLYPYIAADFGSVGGGWLSGFLIRRGWGVGRARLLTMGLFAFGMPAAIWAVLTNNFWVALSLISLATASHQAWSANLFTLASDMFPKKVVASVVGLGGTAGAIGGMFMTLVVGGLLQATHNYVPLFVIAGVMHPLALFTIMFFVGRDFKQADVDTGTSAAPSKNLTLAGSGVILAGLVLIGVVLVNWDLLKARSMSAAVQGLVGSALFTLLGVALLYASRARSEQQRYGSY
jgi:ACS family hexuronate transporter-like MFS transporter